MISKSIYSKFSLLKTAYSFTGKAYLHLSQDKDNWIVSWKEKDTNTNVTANDFENELIQQQLRIEILEKTGDIRKIILGRALASTVLDNQEKGEDSLHESDDSEKADILESWFEHDGSV